MIVINGSRTMFTKFYCEWFICYRNSQMVVSMSRIIYTACWSRIDHICYPIALRSRCIADPRVFLEQVCQFSIHSSCIVSWCSICGVTCSLSRWSITEKCIWLFWKFSSWLFCSNLLCSFTDTERINKCSWISSNYYRILNL